MALTLPKTIAEFKTNLGLGTAADLDVGTSANQVVQLDGSGNLPAVSGANLTGINTSNTPYMSAYVNTNTAITSNTFITMSSGNCNLQEEFDSDNCFDASTGRFTPNVAGWYYYSVRTHVDCGGGQFQGGYVYIEKNGSMVHQTEHQEQTAGANEHSFIATAIVQMNGTTDFLSANVSMNDSSGDPIMIGGASVSNVVGRMNTINAWRLAV